MQRMVKYILTFLLWRNYKVLIVSTVLLVFSIIMINMGHSDYLTWAIMQDPIPATGMSFVYKYLGYVGLLGIFAWVNTAANKADEAQRIQSKSQSDSFFSKIIAQKPKIKPSARPSSVSSKPKGKHEDTTAQADPFANIRTKAKLRSQADITIEKKSKK